jgi:hypothetical protein
MPDPKADTVTQMRALRFVCLALLAAGLVALVLVATTSIRSALRGSATRRGELGYILGMVWIDDSGLRRFESLSVSEIPIGPDGEHQVLMPGAVLIVADKGGIELGGTRFDYGAVVVVEGSRQNPKCRLARPADRIRLPTTIFIFGRQYPKGTLEVPASGNLLAGSP